MKPVRLTVVASGNCPPCQAFEAYWETIAKDWPNVTFAKHDITSPEGSALAGTYMIMAAPGVILNDTLFSVGGVDTKKFIETLQTLSKE